MDEQTQIAKSSIRRRLWKKLGLGPSDGTSFREPGEDTDKIVLCLRESAFRRALDIRSFEGFEVEVRRATPIKVG